jgi:ribosomal protein S3
MIKIKQQSEMIIQSFFNQSKGLIGKPVYTILPSKVVIQIPYFGESNVFHFNALGLSLARLFLFTQLELRFIRLSKPYLDSYIFAQYLALNTSKYNFTRIFHQSKISKLAGIKLELAGRLVTQRNISRKTVINQHIGSFKKCKSSYLDFSQYASKNKMGVFTMKVWLNHSK